LQNVFKLQVLVM